MGPLIFVPHTVTNCPFLPSLDIFEVSLDKLEQQQQQQQQQRRRRLEPQMAAQDSQPFHWRYPDLDDKNFELHGRSLLLLLIVFAVLLFFTLVCLYIRWACRCPGRWSMGASGPGARGPPGPGGLNRRQLGPVGLDPRVISSLPVLLHRRAAAAAAADSVSEREGEESMCSICLSMFADGEKVKMLPKCGHTFHPECVDEWLRTRSSCPLCRACIGELLQRVEEEDGGDVV